MPDTQNNFYKKLLGLIGEHKAKRFLKKKGYKIIATNYKIKGGEADIIAQIDGYVVFVEVKTRMNKKFGEPCEAVDSNKQNKYRKVCEDYLFLNGYSLQPRFDVIEVYKDKINHLENAFQ